jgi:hypothetical protein
MRRRGRSSFHLSDTLAASKGEGQRREEEGRHAPDGEANKAFAHYRW